MDVIGWGEGFTMLSFDTRVANLFRVFRFSRAFAKVGNPVG